MKEYIEWVRQGYEAKIKEIIEEHAKYKWGYLGA